MPARRRSTLLAVEKSMAGRVSSEEVMVGGVSSEKVMVGGRGVPSERAGIQVGRACERSDSYVTRSDSYVTRNHNPRGHTGGHGRTAQQTFGSTYAVSGSSQGGAGAEGFRELVQNCRQIALKPAISGSLDITLLFCRYGDTSVASSVSRSSGSCLVWCAEVVQHVGFCRLCCLGLAWEGTSWVERVRGLWPRARVVRCPAPTERYV
eukprot:175077-Prymnesium_polylepis.1